MRVTYLLPYPELNGGNKVIFQHAALLGEAGHEVTLLADGPRPDWTAIPGRYVDLGGSFELPRQDLVIATYWTTLRRARELGLGPLAHFCQGYEGALDHLDAQLPEIEEVYSWRLPTLTVSPHLGEFLASRFGRVSRTTPPPLDARFHPDQRTAPAAEPWIAVPGIFESEVKGIRTALAAVAMLRAEGLACRLLRFSILPLSDDESGVLAADEYLHHVAPERVADALRACDLLLLPSRAGEGFGLPLLEAMASGVPAVASRIPSTETMGDGAVALVGEGDAAAMAAAARRLLASPTAWREARERGLERADRYRPENVAPTLEEAVRWAAGRAAEAERAALTVSRPRPYIARSTEGIAMELNVDPAALRAQYQSASPFPHIVIDNLFPDGLLEAVLAGFPGPGDIPWQQFESATEKKLGWVHSAPLPRDLKDFLVEMNAPRVLQFLEALTGIEGLIPDPYYGGAGPHQIVRGGFLKVHADFNWHPLLKLDRRLNLLVYLNKDWEEQYGGHLELWDTAMTRAERKILPVFNRTVVFSTTDFSYHGHPHPLACPEGRTRKSVSFYYYSNGRPESERSAPHDTIFKKTHEAEW